MPNKIKDIRLVSNEPAHQFEVAAVSLDDFDIISNRLDVEVIGSACGFHRIDDGHGGAHLSETDCEVASDKSQSARDQSSLAAVIIHAASLAYRLPEKEGWLGGGSGGESTCTTLRIWPWEDRIPPGARAGYLHKDHEA